MSRPQASAKFVVLEGIDGSGTTTQAQLLAATLREQGIDCVQTREPTGGPVGVLLRQALARKLLDAEQRPVEGLDFRSMALLFAADRCDHNQRLIEPALERGAWVISDRYVLSSLIYQSVTAPTHVRDVRDPLPWLVEINSAVRIPDLTVVVDLDAAEAAIRRAARGGERELYEADELQRQLARAYASAEKYIAGQPVRHVDGRGSISQVQERIWHELRSLS
jgi:dTMP kinase